MQHGASNLEIDDTHIRFGGHRMTFCVVLMNTRQTVRNLRYPVLASLVWESQVGPARLPHACLVCSILGTR